MICEFCGQIVDGYFFKYYVCPNCGKHYKVVCGDTDTIFVTATGLTKFCMKCGEIENLTYVMSLGEWYCTTCYYPELED